MSIQHRFLNSAAARSFTSLFPGFFSRMGGAKHNYVEDFGYPETLTFGDFYSMYMRNGLGKAAVVKTVQKTWQEHPEFTPVDEDEAQTPADLRDRFKDLRMMQRFLEVDKRSMVGGYAGLILRVGDDRQFHEPVEATNLALDALIEVIPAWAGQLTVGKWDEVPMSETYGQPLMYNFNEAAVGTQKQNRAVRVHPDRVVIWSNDGTVHPHSALHAGFNALIDAEKVRGSGGEGFWKNARSNIVLELEPEMQLATMAASMNAEQSAVVDKVHEAVDKFQEGFDRALMLQGMKAQTLGVTLPSNPDQYSTVAVKEFAASLQMPMKILMGSQTGERASTEDAAEWAQTCQSRRKNETEPNLTALLNRLVRFGMLQDAEWFIRWDDLTEASAGDKLDRGKQMADINRIAVETDGQPIFGAEEIRDATGHSTTLPEPVDVEDDMDGDLLGGPTLEGEDDDAD